MKILISAMPGAGNLGDDLISTALVSLIHDRYPEAGIGLITNDYSNPFGYPKTADITLLKKPVLRAPAQYRNREKAILSFLENTDIILIGGGGLFQDTHFRYTINRYLKYAFTGKGKKAALAGVGLGIGPFKHRETKLYLEKMLPRFSQIFVRDIFSANEVKNLGFPAIINKDVIEGSDPKWFNLPKSEKKQKAVLGCSIRPWPSLDFDKTVNLISGICNKKQLSCSLFVFEYTPKNTEEYNYAKRLKTALEKKNITTDILCFNKDPLKTFFDAFSSVSHAIAVRYHANILWQKMGVPVFPISYAPKVRSFYEDKGGKVIPIENLEISGDFDSFFQSVSCENDFTLPDLANMKPVIPTRQQLFLFRKTALKDLSGRVRKGLFGKPENQRRNV